MRDDRIDLPFASLNWVEVIGAGVAGVVIGFVWYLPMVFGKRWAAAARRELPAAGSVSPVLYLGSVVQSLVIAYVLALVAAGVGAVGLTDHLPLAFLVWLGFIATTTINLVLFEGKSLEYWLINPGFAPGQPAGDGRDLRLPVGVGGSSCRATRAPA